MNLNLEWALYYSGMGWRVFPCLPGLKEPATTHGWKDASSDPERVNSWWGPRPDYNIAVACGPDSGVYAIDIDYDEEKGANGYEAMKEFGPMPATVTQMTPRGGAHLLFTTDKPPKNTTKLRQDVEVKSAGSYIMLTPSLHPNGKLYEWAPGKAPNEIALAQFPDVMRPKERPVPQPVARSQHHGDDALARASRYLATVEPAVEGSRGHDQLLWAAGAVMHGFLLTDDQTYQLLASEYNPRCEPPWDLGLPSEQAEFQRKVRQARGRPLDKAPGWLLDDPEYAAVNNVVVDLDAILANDRKRKEALQPAVVSQPELEPQVDDELQFILNPPGLVGDLCSYINQTSQKYQPLLTLGAVLAYCGALFGRKVRGHTDLRTNIYCAGVAPSTAGKGHASKALKIIGAKTGTDLLIGGNDIASDTAIERRLLESPSTVFFLDEIGFFFSGIENSKNVYTSKIRPMFMSLFSAAESNFRGKEYGTEEMKTRTISQPCCSIYGNSTIGRFAEAITTAEIIDGWVSRWLIFRTESDPLRNREMRPFPPPEYLLDSIRAWALRVVPVFGAGNGNIAELATCNQVLSGGSLVPGFSAPEPDPLLVDVTAGANGVFYSFEDFIEGEASGSITMSSVWKRGVEHSLKIALIVAAGCRFDEPIIDKAVADYSCRLVRYLIYDFLNYTSEKIVDKLHAKKEHILTVLREAGSEGLLKRGITVKTRSYTKDERDKYIDDLVAGEYIAKVKTAKSYHYWLTEYLPDDIRDGILPDNSSDTAKGTTAEPSGV